MKPARRLQLLLSAALLLAPTLALVPAQAHAQQDPSQPFRPSTQVRSIAVTATDRVIHPADVATVTIGYEIFGPDHASVYASASKVSNAIIDALHAAGVANDAIESQQQSIAPSEAYQPNQVTPAERAAHAFVATQSWTVRSTPRDVARVLDIAAKAGANKSGEIEWSLSDPNAASAEAAAKALQRARTQAAAMATGLNVHLGQLLYASNEVQAQPIRPVPMMAARAKSENAPLAINNRQIETSATVLAVFAIE